MRIVSLQPTATEILFALGLGKDVVGVSHECTYPPEAQRLPVVTRATIDSDSLTSAEIDAAVREATREGRSLYEIDRALFLDLKPDVAFTQDLCAVCASTPQDLRGIRTKTIPLHAHDLKGMFRDLDLVAETAGASAKALATTLKKRIDRVTRRVPPRPRPKVFCCEWFDPIFPAGHWVPELVEMAGGRDGLGAKGRHASVIPWSKVVAYAPDRIVLMACGFSPERAIEELPLLTKRRGWNAIPAVKRGEVYVADGPSYFNGAGPRLVDALEILAEIIHPALFCTDRPRPGYRKIGDR